MFSPRVMVNMLIFSADCSIYFPDSVVFLIFLPSKGSLILKYINHTIFWNNWIRSFRWAYIFCPKKQKIQKWATFDIFMTITLGLNTQLQAMENIFKLVNIDILFVHKSVQLLVINMFCYQLDTNMAPIRWTSNFNYLLVNAQGWCFFKKWFITYIFL